MRFKSIIAIIFSIILLSSCATTSDPVVYHDPADQMPTAGSDAAQAAHQMY